MFKKVISFLLVFCMFAALIPAASATPDSQPVKSVEEILNEYHAKSFEAQASKDEAAAANSRSSTGNAPTLEQETVDQLNAAGYEAYNVTSDNYSTLETELKTDFAELGIDSNGSYIVVVHGEENPDNTPNGARVVDPPSYEDFDGGDGYTFVYTYNGKSYYMRYVTITKTNDSRLEVESLYQLSNIRFINNHVEELLDATLLAGIDEITGAPISTVLDLFQNWVTDDNLTIIQPGDVSIFAETKWTREYIQVWDSSRNVWCTSQCSSYANSLAKCVFGFQDNPNTGSSDFTTGPTYSTRTYSTQFNNKDQRKANAMFAYGRSEVSYDLVGNIKFYLVDANNEVVFTSGNQPLFTHQEYSQILYPLEEEG